MTSSTDLKCPLISLNTCMFIWASMEIIFIKFQKRDFHVCTEVDVDSSNEEQIKYWLKVSEHSDWELLIKEISWPTSSLLLLLYDSYILGMIWGCPGKVKWHWSRQNLSWSNSWSRNSIKQQKKMSSFLGNGKIFDTNSIMEITEEIEI